MPHADPVKPSPLRRAMARPGRAMAILLALTKGRLYRVWFRLLGVHFSAGRNFRVEGTLNVRGPGQVIIGDDVTIAMHVTPWTHAAGATIRIGSNCFLNGTRFGCAKQITIGNDCILSDARIMDTHFHSIAADRWSPEASVRISPVTIGDNVWVAASTGILPGTSIGPNSVVAFGSICRGDIPANVIVGGNPARVIGEVPPH